MQPELRRRCLYAAGLLLVCGLAYGQTAQTRADRACFRASDQKGAGDLKSGQAGVVAYRSTLANVDTEWPFEAYSLAGTQSQSPDMLCLRYELQFGGAMPASPSAKPEANATIEAVRWPDIGLPFVDVDPNHRVSWLKSEHTGYHEVAARLSKIKAFGNSFSYVCALFSVEQAEHDLVGAPKCLGENNASSEMLSYPSGENLGAPAANKFHEFEVGSRYPDLIATLTQAKIPLTPTRAFRQIDVMKEGPPEALRSEFSNGPYYMAIDSEVKPSIDGFSLVTAVTAVSSDGSLTEVNAPTLINQQKLAGPADAPAIRDFVSGLEKRRFEWVKMSGKFLSSTTFVATSKQLNEPSFYEVSYPITIRVKNRVICLLATGYSPFPVNVSGAYCGER